MIVIDEGIRAIFYTPFEDRADYLCAIRDNPDGAGYLVISRFRYYADNRGDPFDGRDHKQWFKGVMEQPLDAILARLRELARGLTELSGLLGRLSDEPVSYELVRGSLPLEDFVVKFQALPFAHSRTMNN